MAEFDAGAEEDVEVEDMVGPMAVDVVAKEDVMEGAMVITHTNYPAGM